MTPEQQTEADFELRVTESKVPVEQGTSAELTVEVVRKDGFTGAIELSASDLPEGATLESATIEAEATQTTLRLSAAEDAPHSLPVSVELRGAALGIEHSVPITVTVCGHPGALDQSFQQGRAIVPVGGGEDYANGMAVARDGKVLVAGRSAENQGDFSVIRLQRDGALDTSFGEGGKVLTDVGGGADIAYAIAVQEDGKVVVAGSSTGDGTGLDFAVVRYRADGQLDDTFGDGGKVTTSLSDDSDTAYALLIQKDGKIVLGGESNQGTSGSGLDFALVRYETDGSLDEDFGDAGRVLTPVAQFSGRDVIYAMASQTIDGEERLVVAGGEGDFAIARYTDAGALDTSFGSDGTVTGLLGSVIGAARAVAVTPDNQIVVAGHRSHDFALVRLDSDGALDPDFGDGAPIITPVSESNWDEATSVGVEPDGQIVVGGWAYDGNSSSGNFALTRYTQAGELDDSFGEGGIVITAVASGTKDDAANAMLLQTDERVPTLRILLAGSANGANHDFAITRYWH